MKITDCLALALLVTVSACSQEHTIHLNQSGFYTHGPKRAAVTGKVLSNRFYLTTLNGKDTVYSGTLQEERDSRWSSTRVRIADFTPFSKTGLYTLHIPGVPASYPFEIGDAPFRSVTAASLKGFYFQRASMPIEEKYGGIWKRPAGHPDTHVLIHPSAADVMRPAGTVISSPGGWYDAGDYNKYIVNSGISMYMLFAAYESYPQYFTALRVNIPESNNNIPDILDEALYNLRWMLTMQDPHDGGVYHKCTNADFDRMVMPHLATTAPRYVVQKSFTATLDFAAVNAMAARIFSKFSNELPGLADSCRMAALKAWAWTEQHTPIPHGYSQQELARTFKPEITTGEYGDRDPEDERSWAAAELYITTGEDRYLRIVNSSPQSEGVPTWNMVNALGEWSLIRNRPGTPVAEKALQNILRQADVFLSNSTTSAFGTVMGQTAEDFNWGGNANAAAQGIMLLYAYQATGNRSYLDFAVQNLDYLLGRNATGYCFVTGIGSKPPMHPHHRPSVADGITDPVPGLLVGGPNIKMQDNSDYPFKEVETTYVDDDGAYASNEITINWNAPLVYLANGIEALKGKAGYVSEVK
ncbi:glycoside hydrolase family 9 protein [Chitinophaga deserti]|uniref:glycoside hydrolase family 9 protein n=1 Tax=Chitinophaga deserti TaxID=2164099 RepID=UPI000D6CE63C|nr:glycoside hydrolase family 9 protein [Chitinophaga deserti]